jgi:hypothetical protein
MSHGGKLDVIRTDRAGRPVVGGGPRVNA